MDLRAVFLSIGVLFGMLVCIETGYRLGRRRSANWKAVHDAVGIVEAAIFALLGLLLAFAFAAGISRLDSRRQLVIAEANAIWTAYLDLDTLRQDERAPIRCLFRQYLDSRLRLYHEIHRHLPNLSAVKEQLRDAAQLQQKIWSLAVPAAQADPSGTAGQVLLPALTKMYAANTEHEVAIYARLPRLILVLVTIVALLSGLLGGYTMARRARRSWLHSVLFAVVIAVTIYTVVDLDDPRIGLIRAQAEEKALESLRDTIP